MGDDDGFEIVGGDGTDGSPFEVAWEGGELVIGGDGECDCGCLWLVVLGGWLDGWLVGVGVVDPGPSTGFVIITTPSGTISMAWHPPK